MMSSPRDDAARFYDSNNNEALFRLAEDSWPEVGGALHRDASEVARFAAIRAHQLDRADQHLWRARSLAAAVISGARDTAAGLLLQPFFATTGFAAENAEEARRCHELARSILEELKRLLSNDSSSWPTPFGRLYHEKRGHSFLMEASIVGLDESTRVRLLGAAEAEFARAVERAGEDHRGMLKVKGSLALVGYLRSAIEPEQTAPGSAAVHLEETRAIRRAAEGLGYTDVEKWAAANEGAMERGEFDGWTPYEVV